jgi:hypothetical protein
LYRIRRALKTIGSIIVVWCMVAVLAMFTLWAWPRTWIGLLLAFTVVPLIYASLEWVFESVSRWGPIARFHARIERRTSGQRISALRIFVFLTEALLLISAFVLLCLGLTRWAGVSMTDVGAFMDRHFWP